MIRNQDEFENYVTGTNSFSEYPSEPQTRENPNLGPLDPPFHKNISKAKRIRWTREEYKDVMTAFYQALKEPKDYTTKQTYELWRQNVGEHRSYIDANKLANVRRDIIKNNRLPGAENEEIKRKTKQPINTEQQNSKDPRVRLENLTPEKVESTIEQVRQGNEINSINQPVQQEEGFEENENIVVESKEATEEIKVEILKKLFKTQNMNITTMNQLTYSKAKAIMERCGVNKKNRNRTGHKQPA